MRKAAIARHEKRLDLLVEQLPDVHQFSSRVAIGSFTMTSDKERYTVKHAADFIYGDFPVTAPELARDYLDFRYPARLRASGEQAESYAQERFAPLYYRPMVARCAHYVDLSGAFWWLMSVIGWNVDYLPGVFLSPGRAPYDFPFYNNKLARNCLVTAGLNNDLQIWTGHKIILQSTYNAHLNRGLYAAIMDILHLFGIAAVNLGAKYVNTDGAILPDNRVAEYLGYLDRFGAPYRLQHSGETIVTGVGSYRIGDFETGSFRHEYDAPMSNLVRPRGHIMLEKTLLAICRDRVDRPGLFMR